MRKWIDETTGREVRQLTDMPEGCLAPYFLLNRILPDGLILIDGKHETGNMFALDPEGGEIIPIRGEFGARMNLRSSDGRAWFYKADPAREVIAIDLPYGSPEVIYHIPEDAPFKLPTIAHVGLASITCDGRTLILTESVDDSGAAYPSELDHEAFWRAAYRPRRSILWTLDIESGNLTKIDESDRMLAFYVDSSRTDPTLFKYSWDSQALFYQRIWTAHIDGTGITKIRPQEYREWTHHEFWWPDGKHIGYKYLDRRNDPTIHEMPWGEYAPTPLHFCIADLNGNEVFKSDPLSCYHSHINVSSSGSWVSGEGTDGHSFVYAAPFSMSNSKIDFKPYAAIHTPYVPMAAQNVEAGFSVDDKWLIYNDTIDGRKQVCAVEVGD